MGTKVKFFYARGLIADDNTFISIPSVSGFRTEIGLGSSAVLDVGTGANQVVQLDGTSKLPAVDGSQLTNLPGGGGGTVQGTDGTYDIQATNEGATAGNARGENSVDLQTDRGLATQVASSPNCVIGGGLNNTASGGYGKSTVSGGEGNTASGSFAFIGGGLDNTASGYNGSTVAGGSNNTASGSYTTIGGGSGHTASGTYSAILGGSGNSTNNLLSAMIVGSGITANLANATHVERLVTHAGPAFLKEIAAAEADIAAHGQLWVKNTVPNQIWFTDDAGTDTQLGVVGTSYFNLVGTAYLGGNQTGNSRGIGSLDVQSSRGLITQVASGATASAFGINNTASGIKSSASGYKNTASSQFASAFGSNTTASGINSSSVGTFSKTTIDNTFEAGYWSNSTTRGGGFRADSTGLFQMTIEDSATAPADGGATAGSEAVGNLGRGMFTIHKNGTAVTLYYNNAGTIQSVSLGTLA